MGLDDTGAKPPRTMHAKDEQTVRRLTQPRAPDVTHSIGMAVACLISYLVMTRLLNPLVGRDDELLGGMWAAVAAAFVFRYTRPAALSASLSRLIATAVSCVLCWALMVFVRPTPVGMAVVLVVGTLMLIALNLRDDVITMAITTLVVMVVAIMSPENGRIQPLLRFIDTVVGIAVGLTCVWAASRRQARVAPATGRVVER